MMLARRGLLLSLLAAPVIIRTPGLLMAVKPVVVPKDPMVITFQIWVDELSPATRRLRIVDNGDVLSDSTFDIQNPCWLT